jgi:hypothetical protein
MEISTKNGESIVIGSEDIIHAMSDISGSVHVKLQGFDLETINSFLESVKDETLKVKNLYNDRDRRDLSSYYKISSLNNSGSNISLMLKRA